MHIDSTLRPGSLTYGELVVPGETDEREILISAHVCHPSLADDNLSGIAVATLLARRLLDGRRPRHTVRFLFAPGTIGTITWLATQRTTAHANRPRADADLSRRRPSVHVQADAGRRCNRSTGPPPACWPAVAGPSGHRLLPLRLRRAAVQLPRIPPAGRLADARSPRGVPRVPHVCSTTSTSCQGRAWPRRSTSWPASSTSSTATGRCATSHPTASRNWALADCTGRSAVPRSPTPSWRCCGCSTSRTASHTLLDIAERSGLDFDTVAATAELLEQHGLLEEV